MFLDARPVVNMTAGANRACVVHTRDANKTFHPDDVNILMKYGVLPRPDVCTCSQFYQNYQFFEDAVFVDVHTVVRVPYTPIIKSQKLQTQVSNNMEIQSEIEIAKDSNDNL